MMDFPEPVRETLRHNCGVDITQFEPSFVERCIMQRVSALMCTGVSEYVSLIVESPGESHQLVKLLFNGYSAFFRNTFTFAVFEHTIVPRLTRISNETQHRELRVWSVGCAAGQESYSLAILLEEASAKEPRGLPYRMFATDLCKVQIAKAALGAYPEAALLTLTMERASEWFTVSNGMCVVNDVLKRNIEFSVFDVCNSKHAAPPGSIYGGFDVIMCSNLLMYYSSSKQDVIIDKLVAALNPGCYLIVGEAERSLLADRGYSEVVAYSAIFRP